MKTDDPEARRFVDYLRSSQRRVYAGGEATHIRESFERVLSRVEEDQG